MRIRAYVLLSGLPTDTMRARWAAGLFIYQSFDAIDGYVLRMSYVYRRSSNPAKTHRKQARRTGMAGPLGEKFDHGASV